MQTSPSRIHHLHSQARQSGERRLGRGGEKEEPLVSSKPLKQKNPPHMQATRERGERDKHRCGLQALSWGKAGQRRRVLAAVKLSLTQKTVTFWKETVEAGSQNFIHCLLFSAAQQIYRKMSPEHQCMRDMDYCAEKKRKNKSAGLVRFSPFFVQNGPRHVGSICPRAAQIPPQDLLPKSVPQSLARKIRATARLRSRGLHIRGVIGCVAFELGKGDGRVLQIIQEHLDLCHYVMGPDVRGQTEMPFAALHLGRPQQCRAKDCCQIVQGHFVDRLFLCNPFQVFQ